MLDRQTLRRHATLMDDMANRVGVDLEEAVFQGHLSFDTLETAVIRCTKCSNPDGCRKWLDFGIEIAKETPGYCNNRDMMSDLKG